MNAVVTGAAGFIGSHLADRLVARGDSVVGIDSLTDYYDASAKLANLSGLRNARGFKLVTDDLCTADLASLLAGADVIFHQAGQPGVRSSWSEGFAEYCSNNVLATQRLLDAALATGVERVVYASSSSVYGNALEYPLRESHLPRPASPYGVTKLAAEHLCSLYASAYGLRTFSLRYFTVYGPRQRPDMALRRLVAAAMSGTPFPLFGSGSQIRDFTYVDDVVEANLLASASGAAPGAVVNIAGGSHAEMLEVIDLVGHLAGSPVILERMPPQPGDVERTEGCIDEAVASLDWRPKVSLSEGIEAMIAWARNHG